MIKKWVAAVILFLLAGTAARADAEISVQVKAAILIEADSGRVLYEQNADERLPMASTTKIMTALIAVEHCGMDEIVTAGKNASGVEGTSIYLSEGEQLTTHQMLQGQRRRRRHCRTHRGRYGNICFSHERARGDARRGRVFRHAERIGQRRTQRVSQSDGADSPRSHAE